MSTLTAPPQTYPFGSTLNAPPTKPTFGVDPGYSTGICLRVENRAVNWGTVRPHKNPDLTYKHGRARTADDIVWWDLVKLHVERVTLAVEHLADTYGFLLPDYDTDTFACGVEQYEGANTFTAIVTELLAAKLTAELDLLPGIEVVPVAPRKAGALYRPKKGGTGRWLDYYPEEIVGRQREFGEPAEDGRPVEVIGNGHGDNINVHVQAAFDQASFVWDDPARVHGVAA